LPSATVIGVMHEGHLHQWDDAYTLYHRPATRFVADFIGHGVFAAGHAGAARPTWWCKPRWAT
jgi:ABC-type Fe3+/spermidine/putrescine transport system ATPase subunit